MTDGRAQNFSLRSWVYIDRMQPQYAAYAGSVIQGDVPTSTIDPRIAHERSARSAGPREVRNPDRKSVV